MDVSRHFSYYAFDGGSGAPRWKHEASIVPGSTVNDDVQPHLLYPKLLPITQGCDLLLAHSVVYVRDTVIQDTAVILSGAKALHVKICT